MKKLEEYVRSIPDFPESGIIFRDVTSILQDADGLHLAIDLMQEKLKDVEFDVVVGPESRGFIFGVPIAYNLHKPFIPIRKKGKLPCETVSVEYELEYGTATIEMHKDAIKPGQRVVIIDDLIATHRFTELKGVIYFTDGQGIYPQKMPLYQTAFVFMDDGAEEQEVPPWAMKLVLDEEDLRGVRNR